MGLISLITNKCLLIVILAMMLASCSSKGLVNNLNKKKSPPVQKKQVKLGPTDSDENSYFKDKTSLYGLSGYQATELYAVDFNNDAKTDLVILPEYYSSPVFLQFDGNKFNEISYNPFPETIRASYLVFSDQNNDGLMDVIVGTLNQKSELRQIPVMIYEGKVKDGKISYVLKNSLNSEKPSPASSIGLLDVDLDGDLDIFVANWYSKKGSMNVPTPDQIFQNHQGKYLPVNGLLMGEHEYNTDYDTYPNATPSFGVGICDVDLNGRPDILVSSSSGYSNKLWLNLVKSKKVMFEDYAKQSSFASDKQGLLVPRGGGNSFFSVCTDYNNDGMIDILQGEIFHAHDPENRDRSSILTGTSFQFPPMFLRTEYPYDDGSNTWTQADRRGSWFDYNNDGLVDIVVDNSGFPPKSRLILFEQAAHHGFEDVAKDLGVDILNPSGTVVLDLNNDGRLDIITGQTNVRNSQIQQRLYLLENNTPIGSNKSVRFYLRGKNANYFGLGATVRLMSKDFIQTRFVEYSNGPLPSQNEEGVHFGMGTRKVQGVSVTWPYLGNSKIAKTVDYKIHHLIKGAHSEITLCESGKALKGKVTCP